MIAQFYEYEQATASLLTWAMSLSILISCLGLLGLATYTINTRSKEIGIRKVLGATVSGIVTMLSKDFVKLVRSEEHTSELQSLMRISYAVFCLKKKKTN